MSYVIRHSGTGGRGGVRNIHRQTKCYVDNSFERGLNAFCVHPERFTVNDHCLRILETRVSHDV